MRDWDDAFNNMGHVKGSDALPGFWAARAAEYRAGPVRIETDIAYGTTQREVFDLVLPDGDPKALTSHTLSASKVLTVVRAPSYRLKCGRQKK